MAKKRKPAAARGAAGGSRRKVAGTRRGGRAGAKTRRLDAKPTAWHATPPSSAKPSGPAPATLAGYVPARHAYDVHPGIEMTLSWIATLGQKTGRSLEEWISLCRRSGPADEKACREWLKREHGHGANAAWWLAEKAHRPETLSEDSAAAYLKTAGQYVRDMFAGQKAALLPVFDRIVELGRALGTDVKICPCKTIVPMYRGHVFAQIKPTTRARIDLGFCLRGVKAGGRLIDTGGQAKNDRITHRVELMSVADIDAQVHRWLRQAYDADKA